MKEEELALGGGGNVCNRGSIPRHNPAMVMKSSTVSGIARLSLSPRGPSFDLKSTRAVFTFLASFLASVLNLLDFSPRIQFTNRRPYFVLSL